MILNRYLCDACFNGKNEVPFGMPLGEIDKPTRCTECKAEFRGKPIHQTQTQVDPHRSR